MATREAKAQEKITYPYIIGFQDIIDLLLLVDGKNIPILIDGATHSS
jgi:hypothetical protein